MVGVAGDGHIVVEVDAQALHKRLRSVLLALVGELLRALAEVGVEDTLQSDLPLVADLLGAVLGNGCHVGLQKREELVEVVQ